MEIVLLCSAERTLDLPVLLEDYLPKPQTPAEHNITY